MNVLLSNEGGNIKVILYIQHMKKIILLKRYGKYNMQSLL